MTMIVQTFQTSSKGATKKTIDSLIDRIYQVLRNGLHHDLAPRGIHVYVSDSSGMMFEQDKKGDIVELWFNPLNFLDAIERDFQSYIQKLSKKSDQILVANFEEMFKQIFNV